MARLGSTARWGHILRLHVKSKIVRNVPVIASLSIINPKGRALVGQPRRSERLTVVNSVISPLTSRSCRGRRRTGRPCQRHRAGGGRRRNAADRAAGRAGSPHHGAAGRLGHGAGNAGRVAGLHAACCAAEKSSHRRRHAAAFSRAREFCSTPPKSGSMRSATTSRTGICSPRSKRAPRACELPRIAAAALAVTSDADRRHHQTCRRRGAGASRDRRRRRAFAVPRGGRHCDTHGAPIRRPR